MTQSQRSPESRVGSRHGAEYDRALHHGVRGAILPGLEGGGITRKLLVHDLVSRSQHRSLLRRNSQCWRASLA